jgi:hypothetical protein
MALRSRLFRVGIAATATLSIGIAEPRSRAQQNPPVTTAGLVVPELLPLPAVATTMSEIQKAYLDVYSILREDNRCSQFFGGPEAIKALNRFALQIRRSQLVKGVAIRMVGDSTIVTSAATGFTFRVFDKVEVNLNGPFYRAAASPTELRSFSVGGFRANTREARATIFLHELGHLVRKTNGDWVLPNDGDSQSKSSDNSNRVLDVCGEQIKALRGVGFADELRNVQPQIAKRTSLPADAGIP